MEARAQYGPWKERPRLTVVHDAGAEGPFAALPHAIIRKTSLSRDARLLVATIQMYGWNGGECRASHATLAADMGCSTRMLRVYLTELIRAEIITEHDAGARRQKAYRVASIGTVLPIEAVNEKPASDSGAVNEKFSTVQSEIIDTSNRKPVSDSKKKTTGKKKLEEELQPTAVDGADAPTTAAAPDQAAILRGLTPEAREVLDWHRQCHGSKRPVKLYPTQARQLEEALADLGLERLRESVEYMAGQGVRELSKAIRAARTKRSRDENGRPPRPHRNGAGLMPPGAASKQMSSWTAIAPLMGGAAQRGGRKGQPDGR